MVGAARAGELPERVGARLPGDGGTEGGEEHLVLIGAAIVVEGDADAIDAADFLLAAAEGSGGGIVGVAPDALVGRHDLEAAVRPPGHLRGMSWHGRAGGLKGELTG